MKLPLLFAFLFSITALAAPQFVSDPLYDEFEGVALAQALLRDGKFEATKYVLERLSSSEIARNAVLVGKVRADLSLAQGDPGAAIGFYQQALKPDSPGSVKEELELGLARALQRLGRSAECARSASRAGELVYRVEADVLMKAGCERASGNSLEAWETLLKGRAGGLGFGPVLDHLRLALSLGLREEAFQLALTHIESASASSSEALSLAESLHEHGARQEALLTLEAARLRFPDDQHILLAIAPLYFAKGWKRATAEAFTVAAVSDSSYAEHAAETLRQSGSGQRSRYWNLYIPGEKERGRQKLALAVEKSRWDLVSSMDNLVKRSALEHDDEVSYALAFSLLRAGEAPRARSYLEKIKSQGLMGKVSALFKSIEECGKRGWRCI